MWDIFVNTPLDFLDAPSAASSFKDEVKMSLLIRAVSNQPATQPKLAQPSASPSWPLGSSQPIGLSAHKRRQRTEELLRKS